MKIAVSGKGGVGKTTVAGLLCRAIEARGRSVIAIDADSNPNLAYALGLPADKITPLAEMKDLIREKVGVEKGSYGAYFQMNPDVSDIPARFRYTAGNVQLLVMGAIPRGNGGCACPEYTLIRSLVSYLLLNEKQDLVIDMEAGLEHFGRGVTEKVDALLVVTLPNKVSCLTASRVHKLASDLGITRIHAIGNQVKDDRDKDFIITELRDFDHFTFLPHFAGMAECERAGRNAFDTPELKQSADKLLALVAEMHNG